MMRKTLLVSTVLLACAAQHASALGTAFTYQGRLSDAGAPANGSFDFEFRLFDASSGGAQQGLVSLGGVNVSSGLFTVTLDFGSAFTGSPRWLETRVQPSGGGGYTTLSPRVELTPAPNALYSGKAGDATTLGGIASSGYVLSSAIIPISQGGTGAADMNAARANLQAAKSGANADITSLSALATPLSITQGGTGSSTLNFVDLSTNQNVNGTKTFAGLAWGPTGSRTETRNDAGALGGRSGFFETSAPAPAANWYAGASSWQHLIETRHSNLGNNYAMQFAGSFFDQRFFARKTNNNAAAAWSELVTACAGVANSGPSCAAPEAIGLIGWGGSTSRSAAAPAGGSGEHWYSVSFLNSGGSFHPHVYLAAGVTQYLIDVYLSCAGSRPSGCGAFSTAEPFGTVNWETLGFPGACISPGQTIFVRIRPLSINMQCQSYTVVFLNG